MTGESIVNNPKSYTALLEERDEQAIQCCINTWNQSCPQYPLMNTTEVAHRKRWFFSGSDVVTLEQTGECGHISRVTFGVNSRLTRSGLREHADSQLVTVNFWVSWNCESTRVRGWSDHIVVDVGEGRVVRFPEISAVTRHVHWYPGR